MIQKIVVLAAGKGTRMLELSKDKPKHLIGVKDKPFLYYLLKNIKQAGFKEIINVDVFDNRSIPHTRGGEPHYNSRPLGLNRYSPHTWG